MGILIDAVSTREWVALSLNWNRFSLFYAAVAIVVLVALVLARDSRNPMRPALRNC